MGYYLVENPPLRAKGQFYTTRVNPLSGGVIVHTTESILDMIDPDTGAENVSNFIRIRDDAGSYPVIVDRDSVVHLVPDSYTTFSVATPGYNSRTWSIAIAARSSDLTDNETTRLLIDKVGYEIVQFWFRNGFNPLNGARWIGTDTFYEQGLANHGDVQPSDRSDAWSRHPKRSTFDQWLIDSIRKYAGGDKPTKNQEGDSVKYINPWGGEERIHVFPDGKVRNCWKQQDGTWSNWTEDPKLSDVNGVDVEVIDDVVAVTGYSNYLGVLMGVFWHNGQWSDTFVVNDFIRWTQAAR